MLRMSDTASSLGFMSGSTLIPSLRYRDAEAAIAWLECAFGFVRHAHYPGPNNTVGHAELRHGSGMIMLGSASNPNPYPQFTATPEEIGGRVTSALYLVVKDCGPVWESCRAAGAEVVMELRDMDYGGRSFTVRDPEGYSWAVGEYDPWAAREAATGGQLASEKL